MVQRVVLQRAPDELVHILHERGDCSAADLAEAIGVSQGSVRRHLDIMVAEGLLDTRLVRQPRGRPVTRYSLSEAGEERSSAANYTRLLDRFLPALADLSEDEISGQPGEAIVSQIFTRVAEGVAREHSPRVRSEDLGTRLEEVVTALREVGILNEVVDEGEAFRLRNVGCPCRTTANETSAACEADRYSIELLVGAPVEQVATIAGGSSCCEYLVQKPPSEREVSHELRRVEPR